MTAEHLLAEMRGWMATHHYDVHVLLVIAGLAAVLTAIQYAFQRRT